jgi:shikimate dehydrogenase
MIRGTTSLIAHLGYPTATFKAPMIYNPYFEKHGIDAVVMPLGCKAEDYTDVFRAVFRLTNIHGALITMPHKITTVGLLDAVSTTVKIAGSCNAVLRRPDGTLIGDMFDGEGFVRGVERKGRRLAGTQVLVVGSGGVGSAIAASLAAAGVAAIGLYDSNTALSEELAGRLRQYYPQLDVRTGASDPAPYDVVVNATPLGMKDGDPMPVDVTRIKPATFVGEVVMKEEMTPLLRAAQAKGCPIQVGTDMLFEQIPCLSRIFRFPDRDR